MAVEPRRLSTMFRLSRLLCLVLLAASTAGCAKLVYNRLDTLAALYVGNLVSLDDQQSSDLRTWLAPTLQWHREKELGRYATFLRELSSEVARPSGRAAYQRRFGQIEGFVSDFAAQTAPQASRLLLELTPAQVEELLANLEEIAGALRGVVAGNSQRQLAGERVKETQRQVKRWTGTITEEQKLLVREMSQQIQPTTNEWLESQRRWRTALGDAFSNRGTAQERILQLLREPETRNGPRSTRRKRRAIVSRCCRC